MGQIFPPAGTYEVTSVGAVEDPNNDAGETCVLQTHSVLTNTSTVIDTTEVDTFGILGGISVSARNASASFSLSAIVTIPSLTSLQTVCSADDNPDNADANNVSLTALAVGAVN